MPTIDTNTIGTGGDYSTLQSWEDAAPSNLVTSDVVWLGELLDEEFTSAATILTVAGSTTDSTRYKHLTVAAGASIFDNASNPARYDASLGAGIASTYTGGYARRIIVSSEANFHLSRVQIKVLTPSHAQNECFTATGSGTVVDGCLLESSTNSAGGHVVNLSNSALENSFVIYAGSNAGVTLARVANSGAPLTNCTLASVGTACNGISHVYSGAAIKNTAVFGVKSGGTLSTTHTYTNCYTDKASPPTGCTTVAFDTSTGSGFENITSGTHDLRIKSTSSFIGAGTASGAPAEDCYGQTRASPPGVGAFEYISAGSGLPTLSNSRVTSITATTAVPLVDYAY